MKTLLATLLAMGICFGLAAVLPALAQQAPAPDLCHNDKISVADSAGTAIRMQSGQVFKVYPGQSAPVKFWNPLDKVQLCRLGGSAWEITNLSNKNTKVKALRAN